MPMAARVPNEMRRICPSWLRRSPEVPAPPRGQAKRREGTHAKEVKYSSNEKKVDLIIALSAHRGSSGLSSAGAPHLPLAVPHVVLGDDCAAQAVVIRGATQARLVLEQLLAHRLLHRH